MPFLKCWGGKSEVKCLLVGIARAKPWKGFSASLFFRGPRRTNLFQICFPPAQKAWVEGWWVWGIGPKESSNHGTKLPARWRSLPGSSSIYGISSVGFTVGTKMLGLQVQVKLLNASPLIIMLLWMCLFLFKWYSWSHLVMTTSKPQHTVHKPPTAMSPSLSSPTSEI